MPPSHPRSPRATRHEARAAGCGLATNYHNISHPSLPNYVGGTSGLGYAAVQKFKTDCNPSPGCSTSATSGTLFNHYSLLGTAEQLLGLP